MKTVYPQNDTEFEDLTIKAVTGSREYGWQITKDDGWCFFIQPDSPVEPLVGMTARFYGKGIGASVRGVFLDGQKVYYRTEVEEKEYGEIQQYGADAKDWLTRWDAGKTVWSIEMGGLGPGYEQAIQMAAAEVLRHLLEKGYELNDATTDEQRRAISDQIHNASFENPVINELGLSGAQYGAATSIAMNLYRRGPRAALTDERIKDRRKIQVSKNFPGMAKM